jgi:hypothetical protein
MSTRQFVLTVQLLCLFQPINYKTDYSPIDCTDMNKLNQNILDFLFPEILLYILQDHFLQQSASHRLELNFFFCFSENQSTNGVVKCSPCNSPLANFSKGF